LAALKEVAVVGEGAVVAEEEVDEVAEVVEEVVEEVMEEVVEEVMEVVEEVVEEEEEMLAKGVMLIAKTSTRHLSRSVCHGLMDPQEELTIQPGIRGYIPGKGQKSARSS
jgi:hypothetical protein